MVPVGRAQIPDVRIVEIAPGFRPQGAEGAHGHQQPGPLAGGDEPRVRIEHGFDQRGAGARETDEEDRVRPVAGGGRRPPVDALGHPRLVPRDSLVEVVLAHDLGRQFPGDGVCRRRRLERIVVGGLLVEDGGESLERGDPHRFADLALEYPVEMLARLGGAALVAGDPGQRQVCDGAFRVGGERPFGQFVRLVRVAPAFEKCRQRGKDDGRCRMLLGDVAQLPLDCRKIAELAQHAGQALGDAPVAGRDFVGPAQFVDGVDRSAGGDIRRRAVIQRIRGIGGERESLGELFPGVLEAPHGQQGPAPADPCGDHVGEARRPSRTPRYRRCGTRRAAARGRDCSESRRCRGWPLPPCGWPSRRLPRRRWRAGRDPGDSRGWDARCRDRVPCSDGRAPSRPRFAAARRHPTCDGRGDGRRRRR